MKYILFLLFACGIQQLYAQSPAWLDTLAANNTTLKTLEQKVEAELARNRATLRWDDPEAEVGYVFGTPKGVNAETSVSLTQSLDWGLLTGQKQKMIHAGNEVVLQNYLAERQQILAEGRRQLIQAVYYNRLCAELTDRLVRAREIQQLYETKFAQGDINRLEWNKVRLNTSITQTELDRARTAQRALNHELQRLNGGRELICTDTTYTLPALPAMVDLMRQVEERHPLYKGAEAAVTQASKAVKVARTEALPTLSVGYTGAFTKGLRSHGMKAGITIPLWGQNRVKIKENRLQLAAEKMELKDVALQLRTAVSRQYTTAMTLQNTADQLYRDLVATDNSYYLRRSLEEGQISLLDYLLELSFYYTARTALLEAERDARLAQAEVWNMLL